MFSIMIPTWNNIGFLKLCVDSIRKNSTYNHQILIYVNDGSDGTLDWVRQNGIEHVYSPHNAGICLALNSLRSLVKTDYIVYMNDDMYACPEWDRYLWEEVQMQPDSKFFISSTMIQPSTWENPCIITGKDYGKTIDTFEEDRLLAEYADIPFHDWTGATWPPNIVHRNIWDLVGGYSLEFSPGMYSDPDFTAKLWLAGVRRFKGLSKSRVYHFESKSTNRIVKNDGSAQFLLKYGISCASFMRNVIHHGRPFSKEFRGIDAKAIKRDVVRYKIKRLFFITRNFMAKKIWEE